MSHPRYKVQAVAGWGAADRGQGRIDAHANLARSSGSGMKKLDVEQLLRQSLDSTMRDLGFRWRRMLRSTDGWYVRVWDGGRDTFGWNIASYTTLAASRQFESMRFRISSPHISHSRGLRLPARPGPAT
jgi:hypothetical protein